MTKEVDWGVARAYVALAEDNEVDNEYAMKRKEAGRSVVSGNRAGGAVERYLDDEEWERSVSDILLGTF